MRKAVSLLSFSTITTLTAVAVAAAAGTANAAAPAGPVPHVRATASHTAVARPVVRTAKPVDALSTYNDDYNAIRGQEQAAVGTGLVIGTGIGCAVGGVIGLAGLVEEIVTLPFGCVVGAGAGTLAALVVVAGIGIADGGRLNAECYAARLPAFDCPWGPQTSE